MPVYNNGRNISINVFPKQTMLKSVHKCIQLHATTFLLDNTRFHSVKTYQDLPTLRQIPIIGHSYLFLPGGTCF